MAARKKAAPKRGASRYQAPAKQPVPGWIWLVCGLVIGGFIMFLMSLEPGGEEVKRAKEAPKTAVKEQPKRTPATEQPPKPKYDFYTLLPESEVAVLEEAWLLATRIRAALLLWTGKVSDVLPTNMRDLEAVARLSGVGTTGGELEERYLRVTRLARQVFETRFYGL